MSRPTPAVCPIRTRRAGARTPSARRLELFPRSPVYFDERQMTPDHLSPDGPHPALLPGGAIPDALLPLGSGIFFFPQYEPVAGPRVEPKPGIEPRVRLIHALPVQGGEQLYGHPVAVMRHVPPDLQ